MAESSWIDEQSRYAYADTYSTTDLRTFVGEREPMDPPPEGEYKEHVVARGDSCFSLSGHYYHGLVDRPAKFWWAIMEANDIIDPTMPIRNGTTVIIPDLRWILAWVGYRHDVAA